MLDCEVNYEYQKLQRVSEQDSAIELTPFRTKLIYETATTDYLHDLTNNSWRPSPHNSSLSSQQLLPSASLSVTPEPTCERGVACESISTYLFACDCDLE